jgi:NAD dependent epimerase/dehydratase family enzyme
MSWIHRDDWVSLATWALTTDVSGPLNATAPQPVTNREFGRALGRALSRPSVMPAPAFALRLLLGEMADALLLSSQRVYPERAQTQGFRFAFDDLDRAMRSIVG